MPKPGEVARKGLGAAEDAFTYGSFAELARQGLGKIGKVRNSRAWQAAASAARSGSAGRGALGALKASPRVAGALFLTNLAIQGGDLLAPHARNLGRRAGSYLSDKMGLPKRKAPAGYQYGGLVSKGRPKMQRSGSLQKLPLLPGNRGSLRNMPDTEFGKRYARRAIDRPAGKSKPSDYFEIPVRKSVKPLGFMCGGKVPSRRGR